MMGTAPFTGTVVVGHLHWDHMMGIPFFPAGDRPGARVHLMIPEQGVEPAHLIERMMSPPFFPIGTAQLRGDWTFGTFGEETFEAEGFTITGMEIPHKGGRTMGLRISDGRTSVAYLSDHAPTDLGPGDDGLGALHPAAVALAQGVDVLIHDAQYTSEELPGRITWGHAAADYAVTLGEACGVGTVLLFHHDPNRTDDQVAALRANLTVPDGVRVEVAVEGAVIRL